MLDKTVLPAFRKGRWPAGPSLSHLEQKMMGKEKAERERGNENKV